MMQFYLTSHQLEDFKRFFRELVRAESKEKNFRVELGGVGEAGVRFLPDPLFPCLMEIEALFKQISTDFEKVKDETYKPEFSTVNFGKLKQSAGKIDLHFDLRLLPDLMPEEITKHILTSVQKIAGRYPSLNITAVLERMNPGLNMTLNHDLVKICQDVMEAANLPPDLTRRPRRLRPRNIFRPAMRQSCSVQGCRPATATARMSTTYSITSKRQSRFMRSSSRRSAYDH